MYNNGIPASLNSKQAATYIGVTGAALKVMHLRGKAPPYISYGFRRIVYPLIDLDRWLENKRREQLGLPAVYDGTPPKPHRIPGIPRKTALMFIVDEMGDMFHGIKTNPHILVIKNHKRVFVIAFIIMFAIIKLIDLVIK